MNYVVRYFFLLIFAVAIYLPGAIAQGICALDPDTGKLLNPDGTPCTNTVVSAVPFLRITGDARSGAMGDAGIALSADPNAMHFNASKLVSAEQDLAVSATYTPWLRALGLNDVYLAYLTGYKKLDDLQAIGLGLRYFSMGSIQFTDENGEALATGRPNEYEVAAAYSRKLSDNFMAGLTGKFIYSNLAAGQQVNNEVIEPATAFAADISFTYEGELQTNSADASTLRIGAVISNIGNKVTYRRSIDRDFLPANLGLGVAWTLDFNQYNRLTFTTDINKLLVPTPCQDTDPDPNVNSCAGDNRNEGSPISAIFSSFGDAPGGFSEELQELKFSFGAEYWYNEQFALRVGYFNEHNQKGARKYLTTGIGLKYNIFGLNFSYLVPTTNQRNPLDNTLRFSLLFDFGAFDAE